MLKNYVLTTFRNISRRKGFSILNILGLSIGLAASLLILQYVKDELSYDDFHKNAERIYRVEFDAYREGKQIFKCATAFPKVAPTMKTTFPEIEDATRLYLRYGGGVVRYEDISMKENNVFQVEQNFFTIFSYPMIDGTAKLDQPNTAIIEEETARKYFGDQSAVGKRIRFGDNEEYEITGVMRSPENSHLKFTFLFSYPTLVTLWGESFENAWGWYDFYNYILLKPGSNPAALEAKLPQYIEKNGTREGESERTKFVLQPLSDIHLYSDLIQEARVNGNGRTVYFLMIIALFILVIAWVNYINLSTARAIERAKEVGVRKAIGAAKKQLVGQFLSEALMVNFFAAIIGIVLVSLAIPMFNEIAGKNLTFSIFSDPLLWLALGGLFGLGTLLSGLYPAFVLSGFQPVKVLKGSLKGTREGLFLRKALVTTQFVFSVGLITGTIVVYRQLQFMTNQDLGIDLEQTVVINGPGYLQADSLYNTYLNGFRNAVNNQAKIKNFTATTEVPGNLIFWTNGALRIGDDVTRRNQMYIMGVDNNFFQTFGNKFLAGRPYSPEFTGDSSSVILNRKAVEMFNLTSPEGAIGQRIEIGRDTLNIVGVVENYHQEGLRQDFRPTAFRLVQSPRAYFCVKVNSNDLEDALTMLRTQYAAIFPNNPFDYFFLDSFFNRQYQNEKQFGSVFSFFSMLAIFVACLGLFGLASFTAAQRTKEIGIRKVLGSSVPNIFLLLSREFLKLVIVANVIAIPLVWFLMENWLKTFAFRIDMSLWFFAAAGIITILIALFTVSYQSITAAIANPVKSLRYE